MEPLFSPTGPTVPELGPWQWTFCTVPDHDNPLDAPRGTFWHVYLGLNQSVFAEHEEQVRQGAQLVIQIQDRLQQPHGDFSLVGMDYGATMFPVPVVHLCGRSRRLFNALLDSRWPEIAERFHLLLVWRQSLDQAGRRAQLSYLLECYTRTMGGPDAVFEKNNIGLKQWFHSSGLANNPDDLALWIEHGLLDDDGYHLSLNATGVREFIDAAIRVRDHQLTQPPGWNDTSHLRGHL